MTRKFFVLQKFDVNGSPELYAKTQAEAAKSQTVIVDKETSWNKPISKCTFIDYVTVISKVIVMGTVLVVSNWALRTLTEEIIPLLESLFNFLH